jgi:hypothetical protein
MNDCVHNFPLGSKMVVKTGDVVKEHSRDDALEHHNAIGQIAAIVGITEVKPASYNSEVSRYDLIDLGGLMRQAGIPIELEDEARLAVHSCLQEFAKTQVANNLPEEPQRDYCPQQDADVIGYLKSEAGFARWIEQDALSRPLLRRSTPRAYTALANWLRKPGNTLEGVGLNIPTKSEVISKQLPDSLDVNELRRLAQAAYRRQRTRNPSERK